MRVFTLLSVTLLVSVPMGSAQEKPAPPGESPQLWLASASQQDGKVVIQIARQKYEQPRKPVPVEAMLWENLREVTLGQTVRAFGVDGKPLAPKAVLKALAKSKGVAVFVLFRRSDRAKQEPFYLALLREGTIALVVAGEDIYPLKP